MSGPHFASVPPRERRWQTRRRLGCTFVARLRVLGYGPFWRPDIITPSKDQEQEQPPSTTPGLQYQRNLLQPTVTYSNLL